MSLTPREKAIAGFAWNAGVAGSALEPTVKLLEEAEAAGFFAPETIAAALKWQEQKKGGGS
jgi:hypothetical protein